MQMTEPTISKSLSDRLSQVLDVANNTIDDARMRFSEQYRDHERLNYFANLRDTDYARLNTLGHTYLDYTGGGLYAESQIQQHMTQLTEHVYGNPHSVNPTSALATKVTESARHYVLQYLNADPEEYVAIFTANASGALKLIGESYPFGDNGQYLLTADNHNSVNGIREYARCCESKVTYAPLDPDTLRFDEDTLLSHLDNPIPDGNNLFAYPAQSNFSGIQHSLDWVQMAQDRGWHVALDAAAYLPTNRLDMSVVKPEFVSLSFYKMFGYPTGIGALIMKRDMIAKMQRPWFAGGTISLATVGADSHALHTNEAAFEDGTINYLGIPAVEIGLRHLDSIGIDNIHEHITDLTGYLLDELSELKHSNGQPLIDFYGEQTTDMHGGTLAFNFYDPNGVVFDYHLVEALANDVSVSLRTGCFCNPGTGETAHKIDGHQLAECLTQKGVNSLNELAKSLLAVSDTDVVGAIRVSVGLATNFEDVHRFITFARIFIDTESDGMQF